MKIKFPKKVKDFLKNAGSRITSNVEPMRIVQFPIDFYTENEDGTYTPLEYKELSSYFKLVLKSHLNYLIKQVDGK